MFESDEDDFKAGVGGGTKWFTPDTDEVAAVVVDDDLVTEVGSLVVVVVAGDGDVNGVVRLLVVFSVVSGCLFSTLSFVSSSMWFDVFVPDVDVDGVLMTGVDLLLLLLGSAFELALLGSK